MPSTNYGGNLFRCPFFMTLTRNRQPTSKTKLNAKHLPFNDGSLGSRNDEERRETRYVM